jgi:ATPase subunit of ABC transporter with duplicated ATPase domains
MIQNEITVTVESLRKALRLVQQGDSALARLGLHPLSHLKSVQNHHQTQNRGNKDYELGESLREVLSATIQQLQPKTTLPDEKSLPKEREWHSHYILNQEYLRKKSRSDLVIVLAISTRTYEGRKNEALESLARLLRALENKPRELVPLKSRSFVFLAPPRPVFFQGRATIIKEIKAKLLNEKMIIIEGLPGAGKSTLATVIAYDEGIRTQFTDGVLWVGLGPLRSGPVRNVSRGLRHSATEIRVQDSRYHHFCP